MSEYWIISIPREKSGTGGGWESLNNITTREKLSLNYKFPIPDLKVGTLDQLVGLSDDLGKLDTYVEGVARKVSGYMREVLEDQRDKLVENLTANNAELSAYVTKFSWDVARYPLKQSLRNLSEMIAKQVGQTESDLKVKAAAYNALKGTLQSLEKKQTGSLLTRNLVDLVRKDHFVLDSEHLTTLLVVVPKANFNDWEARYEKLADMVVPRSSALIFEDGEHGLFSITLFIKCVDDFKTKARENKFVVREFTYNEDELAAGKNELTRLATDKKKQFGPLVRWLKVNFSEAFTSWVHVKALRVFVESVLRYGLPVNFSAILLHPQKKSTKRLREILNSTFAHLDSSASSNSKANDVRSSFLPFPFYTQALDMPGLGFGASEYYPYVYYKMDIDMVDHKPGNN